MNNLHSQDESVIIKKMISGDKDAFLELYNRYHASLYLYVLKFVKLPAFAEDILQDVFLKIWELRKQVNPELSFPGYLFRISRNHVFRSMKKIAGDEQLKLQVMQQFGESVEGTDLKLQWLEYEKQLNSAIASLPPQRRKVFNLCRGEGKKYEEVAGELNISRNTVKEHMVLATRFIKDYLKIHSDISFGLLMLLDFFYLT